MENHNVFTPAQESEIEGAYSDFFSFLGENNHEGAQSIINEMEAKEFFPVAEDMKKILAGKLLHV